MNIVVLTNGSEHGLEIIRSLRLNNIPLTCIVKEEKRLTKKELDVLRKKLGSAAFLLSLLPFKHQFFKLYRKLNYSDLSISDLKVYSDQVVEVPHFNEGECEALLKATKPDIIVLAGSRIIKEHILRIPTIGVLNAHPGLLPQYRGLDVIRWALYNKDQVGVTVHFVNSGIDTGAICLRRELEVSLSESIAEIKKRSRALGAEMMAEVVSTLIEKGMIETISNPSEQGNYYRTMPREKEIELSQMMKAHGSGI